jgi:hypothetical protein
MRRVFVFHLPVQSLRLISASLNSLGIIVPAKLLYKKTLDTQVKARKEDDETSMVGSALLGNARHHDRVLRRAVSGVSGVCISGVWRLCRHRRVDWHWEELGRPSPSPRRVPRIPLWRVFGAWTVAAVSEGRAWGGSWLPHFSIPKQILFICRNRFNQFAVALPELPQSRNIRFDLRTGCKIIFEVITGTTTAHDVKICVSSPSAFRQHVI